MRTLVKYVLFALLVSLLSSAAAQDVTLPYTETFDGLTRDSTNMPTFWRQVTNENPTNTNANCPGSTPVCNDWIVDGGRHPLDGYWTQRRPHLPR